MVIEDSPKTIWRLLNPCNCNLHLNPYKEHQSFHCFSKKSAKSKMSKRLIPLLNRVLVEKIVPPSKSSGGILLPEKTNKLNTGKVVAVGKGLHDKEGKLIPVGVKEGDTVLLPEYGGTTVKLGEKEYHLFRDDDILGTLHD